MRYASVQHPPNLPQAYPSLASQCSSNPSWCFFRRADRRQGEFIREKFREDRRRQNGKLEVETWVSCHILTLAIFSLSLQEYSFQITFRQQWNDNRLTYDDMNGEDSCELTSISISEIQNVFRFSHIIN